MRTPLCLVMLLVSALCALPHTAAAQPVASPTIQSVTLPPDTGVLTITGAGLGADLIVMIDGQSATVLPGATATRVDVQPPATVLSTPGTYRLTVVDPARRVGDVFVVASQGGVAGGLVEAGRTPLTSAFGGASFSEVGRASTVETAANTGARVTPSPMVIEGPSNTAIGRDALAANTTGLHNTASGAQALYTNTVGNWNAAHGSHALYSNTTGHDNTASGKDALLLNTTGNRNSAHGASALHSNTTGFENTASGAQALHDNRTGYRNTATGFDALGSNTTGYDNAAGGLAALYLNTTGRGNAAFGVAALLGNTSGTENTALGHEAGADATTGSYNIFLGANVWGTTADTNTIRIGLPYSGGFGQNQTFIAGIYGTPLNPTAAYPVYIDANGKLGTLGVTGGAGGYQPMSPVEQQVIDQQQQLRDQQSVIDDLRARLARIEALLHSTTRRK